MKKMIGNRRLAAVAAAALSLSLLAGCGAPSASAASASGEAVPVMSREYAGTVLLSVSDTGEGIPSEKLATLFAPQPEMDAASALPPHGVGVGLLLCHQIARAHSGRVMAAPRPGGGTTVTFSMPDRKTGFTAVDDVPFDYAGGIDRTLLCLADALPARAFTVAER